MNDQFRIPDPETRAKSSLVPRGYANANLKAASRYHRPNFVNRASIWLGEILAPTRSKR